MSKPIKNLMMKAYEETFADVSDAVTIDIRGIDANNNTLLRNSLAKQGITVTVVRNRLMAKVAANTALEKIDQILDGPTAVCHGGESVVNVARELIGLAKEIEGLEFKGALMEGVVFGPDEVEKLSKYPTRDEAQSQVIQVVLGPGSQVAGALVGVGNEIAGILKTLEEKLEKGEAVQKVAS